VRLSEDALRGIANVFEYFGLNACRRTPFPERVKKGEHMLLRVREPLFIELPLKVTGAQRNSLVAGYGRFIQNAQSEEASPKSLSPIQRKCRGRFTVGGFFQRYKDGSQHGSRLHNRRACQGYYVIFQK
jgi:hypothetical protein